MRSHNFLAKLKKVLDEFSRDGLSYSESDHSLYLFGLEGVDGFCISESEVSHFDHKWLNEVVNKVHELSDLIDLPHVTERLEEFLEKEFINFWDSANKRI